MRSGRRSATGLGGACCLLLLGLGACAERSLWVAEEDGGVDGGADGAIGDGAIGGDAATAPQRGCGAAQGCFTVYAHGDHDLYHLDLPRKGIQRIGPFRAPFLDGSEDVMTDLAVAPDDTIYVISRTQLYTADPLDGHVRWLGPLDACGRWAVALAFSPDGDLYAADFEGAFCRIDLTRSPPVVLPVGTLGDGLSISGDLVVVGDGTMYGTAFRLGDSPVTGTGANNYLVRLDPATGKATIVGQTGFPRLYGAAFDEGVVFAFTHDGSGEVATIEPATGKGTLYGKFTDPTTGKAISFAGAGVNARVAPKGR